MGERNLVRELVRKHDAAGSTRREELRKLVADRDRLAALMRAGRRAEPSEATSAYRSSYAAMLWKLSEPAAPAEPAGVGRGSAHLTLVDLDDDEL